MWLLTHCFPHSGGGAAGTDPEAYAEQQGQRDSKSSSLTLCDCGWPFTENLHLGTHTQVPTIMEKWWHFKIRFCMFWKKLGKVMKFSCLENMIWKFWKSHGIPFMCEKFELDLEKSPVCHYCCLKCLFKRQFSWCDSTLLVKFRFLVSNKNGAINRKCQVNNVWLASFK